MNKKEKLELLKDFNLYCLTCEEYSLGRKNIDVVREILEAGVRIIQYREKKKSMREKYHEAIKIRDLTAQYNALLIVNDHLDLTKIVEADGVHIGQEDYPVEVAKEFLDENFIIGLTTHTKEQVMEALKKGADYIGLGPIFPSYTKEKPHPPIGIEILEWTIKNVYIPVVAIGGIKESNINEILKIGAKCIAMVTEIVSSPNIYEKTRKIIHILEGYKNGKYIA